MMFGQDGKNGLVTFTEREDRACEATDALTRWLLEEHLGWDEAKEPGIRVDCPICGGPIERIVVRGRGTYYCPKCQK